MKDFEGSIWARVNYYLIDWSLYMSCITHGKLFDTPKKRAAVYTVTLFSFAMVCVSIYFLTFHSQNKSLKDIFFGCLILSCAFFGPSFVASFEALGASDTNKSSSSGAKDRSLEEGKEGKSASTQSENEKTNETTTLINGKGANNEYQSLPDDGDEETQTHKNVAPCCPGIFRFPWGNKSSGISIGVKENQSLTATQIREMRGIM